MNDDTDGGEDRIVVFRRKLSDDFDRIVGEMTTKGNKKSIKSAVDYKKVIACRKDVLQSKAHLQSMLMSRNGSLVEDFFGQLVGSVPDLTEHLHMTTARIMRHVNGMSTGLLTLNGKSRSLEWSIMDAILEICPTLVEGLSRIKICTDEGRSLMSLDIQVLFLFVCFVIQCSFF
ncbi:unnamed protein product [Brassica oleracea var. botrytis]